MLFCCFAAFWGKFTENFSFYSKKLLTQKEALKYSEKLLFSTSLNRRKDRRKFGFGGNNFFLFKAVKWTIINKNCFSPQNEPHTAKLCFQVVFKHFRSNSLKTSLFSPKSHILRKEQRNTQKVCIS